VTVTNDRVAPSARMEEFQREVADMKIRGQDTGPEGRLLLVGVGAMAAGLVMILFGWFSASGTSNTADQLSFIAGGSLGGVGVAVVGGALYVRAAMSRYLRYWLVRLVYEQREQADRIVEAIKSSKQ